MKGVTNREVELVLSRPGDNVGVWGSNTDIDLGEYGRIQTTVHTFGVSGQHRALVITEEESLAHHQRYKEIVRDFWLNETSFSTVDLDYLTRATIILDRGTDTRQSVLDYILNTVDDDIETAMTEDDDFRQLYWWLFINLVTLGLEKMTSLASLADEVEEMDNEELEDELHLMATKIKNELSKSILSRGGNAPRSPTR